MAATRPCCVPWFRRTRSSGVERGEFVSLMDPPEQWREAAAACRNVGIWPVLVGEEGQKDTMLSSPIILYDYPQVAPESPGDFFDGTEIDEMLTLRIMTLTDEEKGAMAAVDERAGALLARTEALAREQLLGLHGTVRGLRPLPAGGQRMMSWDPEADRRRVECVHVGPAEIRAGDRVRLRPRRRADILDLALAGMAATIEAIEQDFEGRSTWRSPWTTTPAGPGRAPPARTPLLLPARGSRAPRT